MKPDLFGLDFMRARAAAPRLSLPPLNHHLFDMNDRLGRVQALWAGLGAVHDRVAAIEAERVLKIVQPLALRFVAGIDEPTIGLQQDGRPKIAISVPPVARTRRRAAGAEDAFVKAVELRPILRGL